jgi:hypothetical protein
MLNSFLIKNLRNSNKLIIFSKLKNLSNPILHKNFHTLNSSQKTSGIIGMLKLNGVKVEFLKKNETRKFIKLSKNCFSTKQPEEHKETKEEKDQKEKNEEKDQKEDTHKEGIYCLNL